MSEKNPGGNPDVTSGASGDKADQKTVSYDSHSKLLSEKKKLQAEMEATTAKLAEYEQAKLEAEGKLKEALENQKKLTSEAKQQHSDLFQMVTSKVLKQQFYREAEKLGCIDPELAYLATNFEGVEFTKELEFDQSILSNKLQDLSKAKPMLFKKDVKMPNDLTPNSGSITPEQSSLKKLSNDELIKLI